VDDADEDALAATYAWAESKKDAPAIAGASFFDSAPTVWCVGVNRWKQVGVRWALLSYPERAITSTPPCWTPDWIVLVRLLTRFASRVPQNLASVWHGVAAPSCDGWMNYL